jgi:hypothetical protein
LFRSNGVQHSKSGIKNRVRRIAAHNNSRLICM